MSKLKDFLKELGTNAQLLEDYKQDPDKTMQDYGLTQEEIDAVCNLDMPKIKSIIGDKESDYYTIVINKHEHGL